MSHTPSYGHFTDRLRRWLRSMAVPALIAAGAVMIVCSTINHYGLTYDEGWYISRSMRARSWARELVTRPRFALSENGIRKYWAAEVRLGDKVLTEQQPGAVKLVCGWFGYPLGRLFGASLPERAGTALFYGACLAAVYVFVGSVWGNAAGAFASATLLLMPRVFAHAHLCALDVPVMSMMAISAALMFAAVQRKSLTLGALSGLAWGVALGCKINAIFLPVIIMLWILSLHREFALRAALCMLIGGPLGFVGTWPWLWYDTVTRTADYLAFHLKHYPVAVSYFGVVSTQQPWHYPLVMAAITTPPVTLALGLIGIAATLRTLWRQGKSNPLLRGAASTQQSHALLLLLGALFTIGPNCLPSAPKYTGERLFLPFFPFLSATAAVGFGLLGSWLSSRLSEGAKTVSARRRLKVLLTLLLLLPALRAVAGTHPFQLSYYNILIGGLQGAAARGMEATYWGDSYMAACHFLEARLRPDDVVWVDLPGCEWIVKHYLAPVHPTLRFTSGGWPPAEASWAIVQNKASELSPASRALLASGPPAYACELDGVPLSLVYGRQSIIHARRHMPTQNTVQPTNEGSLP